MDLDGVLFDDLDGVLFDVDLDGVLFESGLFSDGYRSSIRVMEPEKGPIYPLPIRVGSRGSRPEKLCRREYPKRTDRAFLDASHERFVLCCGNARFESRDPSPYGP